MKYGKHIFVEEIGAHGTLIMGGKSIHVNASIVYRWNALIMLLKPTVPHARHLS